VKGQLKELLTNYGDIAVLWFDGEWIDEWTEAQGRDLYAFCRQLQPSIIINNRVGKGRDGMAGLSKSKDAAGDFGTPEQEVPARGLPGVDWETCMTMNDTWGFKKDDHNWKSVRELIRRLIDIASKGGNFLLNVGPTGAGEIPAASIERLAVMGDWLRINGEAIYGAGAGPFESLPWGRCTARPGRLYLHVFDWPVDGRLALPGLKNEVIRATLLASRGIPLQTQRLDRDVVVTLPAVAPDPVASVVALEIAGDAEVTESGGER
jgi:alpha-L-fucosidase